MNELKPFDDKLAGLIAGLSASRRRHMAAEIAKRLRISQQQRIKRQQARTARRMPPVSGNRFGKRGELSARCSPNCAPIAI